MWLVAELPNSLLAGCCSAGRMMCLAVSCQRLLLFL